MFCECKNLTSVSFPNLRKIGRYFSLVDSFNEFNQPNITTLNLQSVQYANEDSFGILTNLTSTNMTNMMLTSLITINNQTFGGCNNLQEFILPNLTGFFDDTSYLPKIITNISLKSLTNNTENEDREIYIHNMPNLTSLNIDSMKNVIIDSCQKLTKIDFPNCSSFIYSSGSCSSLTSINIGKIKELNSSFDSEEDNIKTMKFPELSILNIAMIMNQNSLTSFSADYLKIIENDNFYSCSSLTSFTNNSVLSIDDSVFNECIKLKNISLPSIVKIGNEFAYGCQNLTELNIQNVKYLGKLSQCGKITKLEFNNLSDFFGIEDCQSLTSISFNNSINMQDGIINCPKLAMINFSQMTQYSSELFNINILESAEEGTDIKNGYQIKVPKKFYSSIVEQYKDSSLKSHIVSA